MTIAGRRHLAYWMLTLGLLGIFALTRSIQWHSDGYVHTVIETIATLLALMVGSVAWIRYKSRPSNTDLFLAAAFIGTAMLDCYHAVVTAPWLAADFVSSSATLIPWSWMASRLFLSIMLFMTWWAGRRERRLGAAGKIAVSAVVWGTALFTLSCFLFFAFTPLPPAYYPSRFGIHRPQEWIASAFFLLALGGYLRDGKWRSETIEHWLVLCLITGLIGQTLFRPTSSATFDLNFDLAHYLKKLSYLFALTGLMVNMLVLYRRADISAALEREIAERKKADEQLVKLSQAIEQTAENIVITDRDGNTPTPTYAALWESLKLGHIWKGEFSNRRKDGSIYEELAIISPIRDQSGVLTHFVAVKDDITERKHNRLQLERLLSEQAAMLDNQLIGIVKVRDRRVVWANKAMEQMLGYGPGEMAGKPTRQNYVDEASYLSIGAVAYDLLHAGQNFRSPMEQVRQDGRHIWLDASATLLDRETKETLWGFVDITERKAMEAALFESQQRLLRLADQVPGGLYQYLRYPDGRTAIPFANNGFYEMYELSPQQVAYDASLTSSRWHPEDADGMRESILESERRLTPWIHEYRVQLPVQGMRWKLGYARPERLEDGSTLWHGFITDITDRKAINAELESYRNHLEELLDQRTHELVVANQALQEAKESAEAASVAKSTFLANMSHEIRTPMNAILGMAHLMRKSGVNADQAKRLDHIDVASKHLLSIINDILDLSKIEAGRLVLEEVDVVLQDLTGNLSVLLAPQASAKGLGLIMDVEQSGGNLQGDPTRLTQALLNYANNAIKFTKQGTITIRVRVSAEFDHAKLIKFEVIDTGIGISREQMGRLFTAFEQADNSTTRQFGGTGLGLAITKRLAL